MNPESLLDKKYTGGLYGGAGYGFEKLYILSQLPTWMLTGLDSLQQELWSDVELFFEFEQRWLLQIKDHALNLGEFREILQGFQTRAHNSDDQYKRYIIVSTGATGSVVEIRNALERWKDVQHLGKSELAGTKAKLIAKLKSHGCEHLADFVTASARKMYLEFGAGWVNNRQVVQDMFVSALNTRYQINQKDAEGLFLFMAHHLETERGKLVDLGPFREMLDKARKSAASYSPRVDYRNEISHLISFYTDYYVGRSQEERSIVDLAFQETPGYSLIKDPPGRGKSAFVCHLIKRYEDGCIPQWAGDTRPNLLYFFARQDDLQNTPEALLWALNAQMLDLLHLDAPSLDTDLNRLRTQFNDLWTRLLKVTDSEQPLILLVDGLDEVTQGHVAVADLLPAYLSPYVHVVVTSRPNPDPRAQASIAHPLAEATVWTLPTFGETEIEELLRAYCAQPSQAILELTPRIVSITKGEPLFARFVCREVIEAGERALARLEHNPPDDVREYLRQQFRQLRDLAKGDVIWDILGLMAVTVGGVTTDELASVLELHKREVSQAIEPIRRFLPDKARFELMPSQLREFIAEEFSTQERQEYQQRLLAWCEGYSERGWPQDTPEYVFLHYPQHLKVAKDFERLHRLVQSREWAKAKHVDTPWVGSLVKDLHSASSACADSGKPEHWPKAMAYQLRRALVEDLMSRLPDEVIVFIAKLDRVDQALDFAKRSWRSFQLFHQIAQVVSDVWPDRALEILQQSVRLFDRANMVNRYGARLITAKEILENDKIRRCIPSSTQKAQDLVRQAQRIEPRVSESDTYLYKAQYLCPALVLTDRLDEASELAESLPLPAKSQAFRCISVALPPRHPQKVSLAKKALSILKSAERNTEVATREVQAIVNLLPFADYEQREKLIRKLIADEEELQSAKSLTMPSWSWVIENIAKLDLERAKDIVFSSKWPSHWKNSGYVLIKQIALTDPQEALGTAEKQYSNYVSYRSILVDIIRVVAVERGEIPEAKELIDRYRECLAA